MKSSILLFVAFLVPGFAFGETYIYPNKGQSQQQQSKDHY